MKDLCLELMVWGCFSFLLPVVPAAWAGPVPEDDFEGVVCRLYGLSSVEEAGEERMRELRQLLEHPLRVNEVSFQVLQQSVLFTPYQAAALWDYITETGALLSALELGMVDGFR